MRLRFALVALVACGSGQHGTSDEPKPRVITYGPLGIKTDAKQANQAVILGTDDKNGSTVLPLPTGPAKANVDAMYVELGGGSNTKGGITPVKLATAPNPDQSVQVGIYEEFNGGTGPQWRAGVWVSAIVAANVLGKDLTDFTFSASNGGYIDGASASGLMAGGFLAAMTGAPVDPQATMTGIINPDGSIGPVGGIPEKFLGSIEKGKKKLGYPIGMRKAKSEANGQDVDLVDLAKAHGAEAVEVADVHEAYKLLTGKELPETVPVSEAEMKLDAGTSGALESFYKDWEQKLAHEWAAIVQLDSAGKQPAVVGTLRDYTKKMSDSAANYHKKGVLGAAYQRMLYAWAFATATNSTVDILNKIKKGDITGAIAVIDTLDQLSANQSQLFTKIGTMRPKTLGGHLQVMAAFKTALEAYVYRQLSDQIVGQLKPYLQNLATQPPAKLATMSEEIANAVGPTALYLTRTATQMTMAVQEIDFEKEDSVQYMCSIPNVVRMSTSFQSAASAGLTYFDTMVIDELAKAASMTVDDARNRFGQIETDYVIAYAMTKLAGSDMIGELKKGWGEKSLPFGLMTLAASELSYYDSAELIAKYYSLGVHTDDNNQVSKVDFDSAFNTMLVNAERSARSNARAAKIAAGAIPIQARLSYEVGVLERDSTDLTEKVDALAQFWNSSAYSQTAVMLARN
ncbi:MAG: hypothetical protein QM831_44710 [Kofleriaceae bacterium]